MKTKTFLQIACLVWALTMPQLMQAQFAGGTGTENDPFQIETIDHLNSLRTSPYFGTPTYYFELIADINLADWTGLDQTSGWLPIPAVNTAFKGHFNGGNHTISGVWVNRTTASNGFFSRLEGDASVENLKIVLDNTKGGIKGANNVGGIAGVGNGNITISGCSITGNVTGTENIGGIIGISNVAGTVSITNSSVAGDIKGNTSVGGIIGVLNGAATALALTNSSVTGNVQSYVSTDGAGTGGLVGTVIKPCTLTGCSVSGTVLGKKADGTAYIPTIGGLIGFSYSVSITDCHAEVAVTGLRVVGGFIGRINAGETTITNSSASGDITAITGSNTSLVGGIVGFADGTSVTLEKTHYTGGTVRGITSGNNDAFVGGLIGRLGNLINCTINNSSAKGFATSLRADETTYAGIVGGFIGGREGTGASNTTIQKSYATNTVSGATNVGGLIGFIPNTTNQITQSYATGTVNGTTNVGGFVGGVSANASLTISESYTVNRVNNTGAKVGGFIGNSETATITFENSVAANSAILGTGSIGTLIGSPKASGTTVTNSLAYDGITYTEGKTPNTNTATLIYNATEAPLATILAYSTYSDWDFTDAWTWGNDGYKLPVLKNLDLTEQPTVQPAHLPITTSLNTDATLSALTVSVGTLDPAFAPATTAYTVDVANDVTSITITATAGDANASLIGAGTKTDLTVGDNNFSIVVTAEDGTTKITYTVKVVRAAPVLSTDATLSTLTVSEGTLTPVFDPATTTYSVEVANTVTSITITATANDANASLVGDGTQTDLTVGDNVFNIVVTAEDGTTTETYTVTVKRADFVSIKDVQSGVHYQVVNRSIEITGAEGFITLTNAVGLLKKMASKGNVTSVSVSAAGVYVLTINNNSYKVLVK
jgi:hypothetical protein